MLSYIDTPPHRCAAHWHGGAPDPLSARINSWLWLSIGTFALSAAALTCTPTYRTDQQTRACTLALAAVALLYAAILLALARRERTLAAEDACAVDPEDRAHVGRLRGTLSVLMLAVGQSALAALAVYVGVRASVILSASQIPPFGPAYADLALVAGELGLMGYVVSCCIIHKVKIEEWTEPLEGLDDAETARLLKTHEEE